MTLPPLWPHQVRALDFLRKRRGGYLAMDMGTAKTRVVIERICDLIPKIDEASIPNRVLIFCPKAVIDTWSGQIDDWTTPAQRSRIMLSAPEISSAARRLTIFDDEEKRAGDQDCIHVVVVNYEAGTRNEKLYKWLRKRSWSIIVCDESQALKSHDSQQSKRIAKLDGIVRICLSGTPTPHSPLDWFGQFRFLTGAGTKSVLSTEGPQWSRFSPFRTRYAKRVNLGNTGIKKIVGYQNIDELERRVAPYVFRVKSEDVLDLPGVEHVARWVTLSAKEKRAHDGIFKELFADIGNGMAIVATNVLDRLNKCQQITGGACRVSDEDSGVDRLLKLGRSKFDALVQLLSELGADEPVTVFARYRADLEQIRAATEEAGRQCFELSGNRNELKDWKLAKGGEVIAVQIQSGGAGIDLTRCARVVYWSIGFDLGNYLQSLKRAHRPGQNRAVQYFHLIARDSFDVAVYRAVMKRRDLVEESLIHVRQLAEAKEAEEGSRRRRDGASERRTRSA